MQQVKLLFSATRNSGSIAEREKLTQHFQLACMTLSLCQIDAGGLETHSFVRKIHLQNNHARDLII